MKVFKTPRFVTRFYPRRTWGFSMNTKSVYLTFDDGPTPKLTKWIVDFLDKENIPATFFCVGENVKKLPEEFIRLQENGHQIGSHTMRHENANHTDWSLYKSSVDECAQMVGNNLFRPPYC